MRLTADEYVALDHALADAFEGRVDYSTITRRLDLRLSDLVGGSASDREIRQELIAYAEGRDHIWALIDASRAVNPHNVALMQLAAAVGTEPGVPAGPVPTGDRLARTQARLERMVDAGRGIADLGTFAERLHGLMRRVCAVELGNDAGTGFLIGPRTVLTNHHVVASAIAGRFPANKILLRFDYQRVRDGRVVNAGVEVELAEDWLVRSARSSAFDITPYVDGASPEPHELDYAVLRLARPIGNEPATGQPDGESRGWIEPRLEDFPFDEGSFLMIVQHPCHDPIAYDFVHDAVIRVIGDRLRVHYRPNTMPGSSGSPVLDRDLELVALHHAGQPGSPDVWLPCRQQVSPADYNQGVPIATIRAQLESYGDGWVFGQEQP